MKSPKLKAIAYIAIACAMPMTVLSCKSDNNGQSASSTANSTAASASVDNKNASDENLAANFQQLEYKDTTTGKTLKYNLFTPANVDKDKAYPLVLFIGDASTAGKEVTLPATKEGAQVWTTDQWQSEHPCYVLVPQFSEVAVNDVYQTTSEADIVIRLLNTLNSELNIDTDRIYTTGQSMGGMLSMYYDVAYPRMFAAAMFVDSPCDKATFDSLVKHKFIYFISGNQGKAYQCLEPIEDAARKEGVSYTYAEWSAQLPQSQQDDLAKTMLGKGAPVNIFQFEAGTVVPDGVEVTPATEHIYSFDYAYRNSAAREWLFNQHK